MFRDMAQGCGLRQLRRLALFCLVFVCVTIVHTIVRTSMETAVSPVRPGIASIHQTPTRDFRPGEVHQVLILSYQRSGSSFFGQLFGGHKGVFFAYEPLDGLYVSLYGTKMGWNVPTDITSYANGTERLLPETERLAAVSFLDDIFNCRAETLPPESLYHAFWNQFSSQHTSVEPLKTCVRKTAGAWQRCLRLIPKECMARFDPGRSNLEYCHQGMRNNTKPRDSFLDYRKCVDEFNKKYNCRKIFRNLCQQGKFRGIKTVRATMASVGDLLERNPNLRVVHLIRDPRAVVWSRKHFGQSGQGLFSIQKSNGGKKQDMNMVKEAELYCSAVLRDVRMRKELDKKYPGALVEVIYDDFVQWPLNYTEKLYEIIGVDPGNKTWEWLLANTQGAEAKRNSSYISHKWERNIPLLAAKRIDKKCASFFEEIPYQWSEKTGHD